MRNVVFSDPYANVETVPVVVGGQEVIGKTAVRVTDESGTQQVTAILSSGYDLIKNQMAYDIASDVFKRSGYTWKTLVDFRGNTRMSFDGKRYLHHFVTEDKISEIRNGHTHEIRLGAMLYNSYDGSSKFGMELFIVNMSCTNQYVSRNRFGYFSIRHDHGQNIDISDASQQLVLGAEKAIKIVPRIEDLQKLSLQSTDIVEAKRSVSIPQTKWGDVLDHIEYGTWYGLYQAMTWVTSHEMTGMSSISAGTSCTEWALK